MILSIIIPCYNEEKNIPYVVERLRECVGDRNDIEIILVNNGSTDQSETVLKSEISKSGKGYFILSTLEKNIGYGFGILTGLSAAKGDVLSWTHADMQTDPNDVIKAYEQYFAYAEQIFLKGKRKRRRPAEVFFTFGMQIFVWIILGTYLDDINAQPKMFSRVFYEKYIKENAPFDFSLDLFAMYRAKKTGCRIVSFPVYFAERLHGEAKGGGGSWKNRLNLIKRTFIYTIALKKYRRLEETGN